MRFNILIFGIISIGLWVRLVPIFAGDTQFLFDHGRDLWDVKRIVFDHKPTLLGPDTGLHGVFNGPYHYYLLAIPILLSNGHPLSGSVFNAILNVLAIYLCYELGRRMVMEDKNCGHKENAKEKINSNQVVKPEIFGIIVATIFAFARGSVNSTMFFWNPNWIVSFTVLVVYFLWIGLIRRRGWGLVAAGFVMGICANTEVAYGAWQLPMYVVMVSLLWPQAWKLKWSWLGIGAFLFHFWAHVLFDLRHDFLMTRAVLKMLLGNNLSLGAYVNWPDRLWVRVAELFNATGGNLSADENRGVMMGITAIILGVSVYLLIKNKQNTNNNTQIINAEYTIFNIKREILFFVLPFVVYLICFWIYPRTAWPWYWTGLQVFFYFLCGYLVWRSLNGSIAVRFMGLGLFGLWFALTLPYHFKIPTFLNDEPGRFSNMLRVVDSVFEDSKREPFGVYTYTAPIKDYAFSYVFWWRGRTKYGYEPYTAYALRDGEEIPKTVYLVIEAACSKEAKEPDCEYKRSRVSGWLEKSTPKGIELWQKDFPGRLVVAKRAVISD